MQMQPRRNCFLPLNWLAQNRFGGLRRRKERLRAARLGETLLVVAGCGFLFLLLRSVYYFAGFLRSRTSIHQVNGKRWDACRSGGGYQVEGGVYYSSYKEVCLLLFVGV